jgi:hypothetical protein
MDEILPRFFECWVRSPSFEAGRLPGLFGPHEILQLHEEALCPDGQHPLPFRQVCGQDGQVLLAGQPGGQGSAGSTEELSPGFPTDGLADLVKKHEVQLQGVKRVGLGAQKLDAPLEGTVHHPVIVIASEGDVWMGALEQVLVETEFLAQTAQRSLETPGKGIEFHHVAPLMRCRAESLVRLENHGSSSAI